MAAEELFDYAALAGLSGLSEAALRKRRSRGQLPEPDAPGPRWRRATLAEFLKEGAAAPSGAPSVPQEPRGAVPAPGATPEPGTPSSGPPLAAAAKPPWDGGDDPEERRKRSLTLAEILRCVHPPESRKVLPYTTLCLVCGRVMVGRDSWGGAGYAGWDAAKLATCPHPAGERISRPWGPACGVCGQAEPLP